ncbi:unnamed protein product [Diamesa serratosioi]
MDFLATRINTSLELGHIIRNDTLGKQHLIEQFSTNRNIKDPAYHILIILYSALIILGASGNTLVVLAIIRNKQMRTARNMFIVNLAISDLLLCLVTMPLTLIEILTKYYPFGTSVVLCKLIGTLQGTSIFVSTISITAIALDRYQVILYPTSDNIKVMGAFLILTGIWILAIMCAAPLFIFRDLIHYEINISILNINTISYCVENWPNLPVFSGRVYYSLFSLALQYFIPILVVSSVYLRIYFKLKNRLVISQKVASFGEHKRERTRGRRMQRTNCLLISIALIFGISWLPLNLFNLYADLFMSDDLLTQKVMIIYAICHMAGMSSACSNPMLYGWLNDNFRKEFNEILCRRRIAHLSGVKMMKLKASSTITSVTHKQVGLLKPLKTTDYQSELTVLYIKNKAKKKADSREENNIPIERLKKLMWPLFIGLQVVKTILLMLFLPSIIGSVGKIVGKGLPSLSGSFSHPTETVDDLEFKDNSLNSEHEGAGGANYNAYQYNIPEPTNQNFVSQMYVSAQANNALSRFGLGGNKVQYVNSGDVNYRNNNAFATKKDEFKIFHDIPSSSLLLTNYDPFYSPLLSRLDAVFHQMGLGSSADEMCREKFVCLIYANPAKYAPYSNLVSAQLSRELNELKKPTSENPDILRFFKYMRSAKDGQDGIDCEESYKKCSTFSDMSGPAMINTFNDINKLVQARKLH